MGGCFSTSDVPEAVEGEVNFNHFRVLRAIGKGAFGKVCIVKKRDTLVLYAMKYMSKARVIRKHAVDNVLQEAEMLKMINHPFLVNLWFAFQDQEDLFLVVDLLLGGDLSWHVEQDGRLDMSRVKLYVAEIALALQYLRTKSIIHRDVKPANMLLDSQGHIHLTDFNVACYKQSKPITLCTGTKPYMAPEMFNPGHRGYSYAVDWWSLGVSAYELLKGSRPFHISSSMQSFMDIYSLLLTVQPPMSPRWDSDVVDLLSKLMHPHYHKRMSNLETLRQHPMYSTWDFVQVQNLEITPPFVPPKDQVNCDPTHELEEIILEPNPLHKKSQRLTSKNATLAQTTSSQTELTELNRLQSSFKTYNRLEDEDKIAQERELHRKISCGDAVEAPFPVEPQLPPVADDEEGNKEKGGETPTIEPAEHTPKEADGLKVENPIPAIARDDSKETKESGAGDSVSAPAVGKADVEAGEAAKVEQSGVQDKLEGAKGSAAEDTHHQQATPPQATGHEMDAGAPSATEQSEGCEDPVAVSSEPKVDSTLVGLETDRPLADLSSSSVSLAETKQATDVGEVSGVQVSDQSHPSGASPPGGSPTESVESNSNSLTEKLLSST